MTSKKDKETKQEPKEAVKVEAGKVIAKKDWSLHQNDVRIEIKKGDELKDIPKHLLVALKTEKVI